MAQKLKVGIIGSGSIATFRHVPEYAVHPDVEIVGFADRYVERSQKLAKQYGGQAFGDFNELLAIKEIDEDEAVM